MKQEAALRVRWCVSLAAVAELRVYAEQVVRAAKLWTLCVCIVEQTIKVNEKLNPQWCLWS